MHQLKSHRGSFQTRAARGRHVAGCVRTVVAGGPR